MKYGELLYCINLSNDVRPYRWFGEGIQLSKYYGETIMGNLVQDMDIFRQCPNKRTEKIGERQERIVGQIVKGTMFCRYNILYKQREYSTIFKIYDQEGFNQRVKIFLRP